MDIEKLVRDCLDDFYRRNSEKKIPRSDEELYNELVALLSKYDLHGLDTAYSICSYLLYYILSVLTDTDRVLYDSECSVRDILARFNSQEEIEDCSDPMFYWTPEAYSEAWALSVELYSMACEAYREKTVNEENAKRAADLFKQLKSLQADIENAEYVYNTKQAVMAMYRNELSEATMDADVVAGQKVFTSFRLAEYLRNSYPLEDDGEDSKSSDAVDDIFGIPPDDPDYNPFMTPEENKEYKEFLAAGGKLEDPGEDIFNPLNNPFLSPEDKEDLKAFLAAGGEADEWFAKRFSKKKRSLFGFTWVGKLVEKFSKRRGS